jgi:hypothetical protein
MSIIHYSICIILFYLCIYETVELYYTIPRYMISPSRLHFYMMLGSISMIVLLGLMVYGFFKIKWWEVILLYLILFIISGAISVFVLPRPTFSTSDSNSLIRFFSVRILYSLLFFVIGVISTILLVLK